MPKKSKISIEDFRIRSMLWKLNFRVWFNDRSAYIQSFFTQKPVSRKYDFWYYQKGKLISKYELHENYLRKRFAEPNKTTNIKEVH